MLKIRTITHNIHGEALPRTDVVGSVQEGLEWAARMTTHVPVELKQEPNGDIGYVQVGRLTVADRALVKTVLRSVNERVRITATHRELTARG